VAKVRTGKKISSMRKIIFSGFSRLALKVIQRRVEQETEVEAREVQRQLHNKELLNFRI
jgi:hypothetical protein